MSTNCKWKLHTAKLDAKAMLIKLVDFLLVDQTGRLAKHTFKAALEGSNLLKSNTGYIANLWIFPQL